MWKRILNLGQSRPEVSTPPADLERHKVLVYEQEARNVANLTLQYPSIETGGSLFGYWTHGGSPVVVLATGPGLHSRHAATSFYQDEAYLHDIGTALYDRHGLQHVGEWHSHHRLGLNRPSAGDADTIWSGMQQKGWIQFVLLITTIRDESQGVVLKNYFLFSTARPDPEPLRIMTLPGSSPFRTREFVGREEQTRAVEQMAWAPGPLTPDSGRKSVQEVFPDAWFTSEEARTRLVRIQRDFCDAGIECHMVPLDGGRSLKLDLGEIALILGPDFPHEAPHWQGAGRPPNSEWTASADLAAWYLSTRTATLEDEGKEVPPKEKPVVGTEGGTTDATHKT